MFPRVSWRAGFHGVPCSLFLFLFLFLFVPEVPTKARACKHVYKHAVAPPSVSSRGHTVGTGDEFNSRGYLDIDVLSLCTNIRSLIQHQIDKCNARFACGDGESSENIPLRRARDAESF